jgi:hypothetical protein
MPQDMKHYEALLAITQALGMRHPKPRSLQPHPEMRQGFSLLMSRLNRWDEKVDPRSRMALSYR